MIYRVLPSFTGFYYVILSFTGFYWVILGFTGFYYVILGFTGLYWVLLGSIGFIALLPKAITEFFITGFCCGPPLGTLWKGDHSLKKKKKTTEKWRRQLLLDKSSTEISIASWVTEFSIWLLPGFVGPWTAEGSEESSITSRRWNYRRWTSSIDESRDLRWVKKKRYDRDPTRWITRRSIKTTTTTTTTTTATTTKLFNRYGTGSIDLWHPFFIVDEGSEMASARVKKWATNRYLTLSIDILKTRCVMPKVFVFLVARRVPKWDRPGFGEALWIDT